MGSPHRGHSGRPAVRTASTCLEKAATWAWLSQKRTFGASSEVSSIKGSAGWSPAEAVLHKQFSDLKEAISHEVLALEHAKTRRALTTEEDKFASRMKKLLERAEHAIEKEL